MFGLPVNPVARRAAAAIAAVLTLFASACGDGDRDPSPGEPDPGDASGPPSTPPSTPPPAEPPPATPPNTPSPPAQPGSGTERGATTWLRQLGGTGDESVVAIAAVPGGDTVALLVVGRGISDDDGPPEALGLVRLDASGEVRSSRELPNPHRAEIHDVTYARTPSGDARLAFRTACAPEGCFDAGAGPAEGSVVLRLEEGGEASWQLTLPGDLSGEIAVDDAGRVAVAFRDETGSVRVRVYGPDGTLRWEAAAPPSDGSTSLAFRANGDLVFASGNTLQARSGDGEAIWSAEIGGEDGALSEFRVLGTTPDGTVVASVRFWGRIRVGDLAFEYTYPAAAPDVLVVLDADGNPLRGRPIPRVETAVGPAAVDREGRIALRSGGGSACLRDLWMFDLALEEQWRRDFSGCSRVGDFTHAFGLALAFDPDSGRLRVGGTSHGPVDLGTGPLTSRGGWDGFVLEVVP